MPERRERILVFRSGRHLHTAIAALRSDSPACDITVVATPSGSAALDDAGIPDNRRVTYDRASSFQPWPFVFSSAAARVMAQRFDRVCVLWNDPEGTGMGNVDRTALLVAPGGFTAITADGRLVTHRSWPVVRREAARAVRSIALMLGLGFFVFLPARVVRSLRK